MGVVETLTLGDYRFKFIMQNSLFINNFWYSVRGVVAKSVFLLTPLLYGKVNKSLGKVS